jgi:hypothetical protein
MHIFKCEDCDVSSERVMLRNIFSDADWHNTMTGHDVSVTEDDGTNWTLTNEGWKRKVMV